MYRSILVPLDGTEFGDRALPLATEIARRSGAAVELAHVHEPQEVESDFDGLPQYRYENVVEHEHELDRCEMEREERWLRGVAARIAAETGTRVTPILLCGAVGPTLDRLAEEDPADLVVMATHGRSGLARLRRGSFAESMIRHAHAPILLLPYHHEGGRTPLEFRHILVPLDGSVLAERILPHVEDFARMSRARVTLLRLVAALSPRRLSRPRNASAFEVLPEEAEHASTYLEAVAGRLERGGLTVDTDVAIASDPARAIAQIAADRRAELIAMATHGRGGVGRLLLGGVTHAVLRRTDVPMLVLRGNGAERTQH